MPPPWTPDLVADRLVAAFRRMPSCPVLSSARGFLIGGVEVEAFGWPERFVEGRRDRSILMTWARCRSIGQLVRPVYREMDWNPDQAEYRRRVALGAIARGLNDAEGCKADLTIPKRVPEPAK